MKKGRKSFRRNKNNTKRSSSGSSRTKGAAPSSENRAKALSLLRGNKAKSGNKGVDSKSPRRKNSKQNPEPKVNKQQERKMRGLELVPTELYPVARSIERKLFLVSGPTNSGKTYTALKRFEKQSTGTYLGPLRLLALEVRDTLAERGLKTNLVTGELIEEVEGANFTAATIEMLNLDKPVDMIIIDEIQMLADPQRGSVWLQAVLGAPAKEVWMLGAPESEEAVQHLADHLGEELEIIRTERLSPLEVSNDFNTLENIPSGAAVIAFSRRDVLGLAAEMKEKYNRTAAVLYGALSPEVRREQARMFREGEADVLISTDCIGMGLNLRIGELYFITSTKWNGRGMEEIPHDLVWQIAGRAGRYGLQEKGIVSALNPRTLRFVQQKMSERPKPISKVFNFGPSWPVIRQVAQRIHSNNIEEILNAFNACIPVADKELFTTTIDQERLLVAKVLDSFWSLDLKDKSSLLNAPVPVNKDGVDESLHLFAEHISNSQTCPLSRVQRPDVDHNISLELAEYGTRIVTLYCWLHYRYPTLFPDLAEAKQELDALNKIITEKLSKIPQRRCPECGVKLPWNHHFELCDPCFHY